MVTPEVRGDHDVPVSQIRSDQITIDHEQEHMRLHYIRPACSIVKQLQISTCCVVKQVQLTDDLVLLFRIDKDDRYGCDVFDHVAAAAAAGIAGIVGPAQSSIVICNCFSISAVSEPAISVAAVLQVHLVVRSSMPAAHSSSHRNNDECASGLKWGATVSLCAKRDCVCVMCCCCPCTCRVTCRAP